LVSAQQPAEASAIRQIREYIPMISVQPAIEGPVANAFYTMEQADSSDFTGPQIGPGMLGRLPRLVVYFTKQLGDKILGSQAILLGWLRH
jgi:hypothetical protein